MLLSHKTIIDDVDVNNCYIGGSALYFLLKNINFAQPIIHIFNKWATFNKGKAILLILIQKTSYQKAKNNIQTNTIIYQITTNTSHSPSFG